MAPGAIAYLPWRGHKPTERAITKPSVIAVILLRAQSKIYRVRKRTPLTVAFERVYNHKHIPCHRVLNHTVPRAHLRTHRVKKSSTYDALCHKFTAKTQKHCESDQKHSIQMRRYLCAKRVVRVARKCTTQHLRSP